MNSFARFIFTILAVGIVVNLSVVFLANAQSQRRQMVQDRQDQEKLDKLFAIDFDKSLRRADVAVESQRVAHDGTVIESTLLVCQYRSTGSDQSILGTVQRLVIPGDRLAIYGTMLVFDDTFAQDAPEFRIVRNKKLVYFSTICGEHEQPVPNQPDDRLSLMPPWITPDITRLDINTAHPTHPTIYEVRLWKYIWNRIPDERHPAPWRSGGKDGLVTTFMKPAVIPVRLQHTYTAWIDGNDEWGNLSWKEDDAASPRQLTQAIVEAMKSQEMATQPAALAPATSTGN